MRHAADVPKLREDLAAGLMYGVGDFFPTGDVFRGVNAGRPGITLALLADLRAFADDQPGAGALGIIFSHHVGGDVAGAGP